MSQLDSEINLLKQQINKLEEQKKIQEETELKKKENPLNKLKDIIDKRNEEIDKQTYNLKKQYGPNICNIDKYLYNPLINNDTKQNIRTMSFLEPIFYMLKDINERLEVIEKKN
jgi:small-conductance mechanosensitive channel